MHTIVQLVQGTPEWHAHRAKHFNASEASAMLGLSPYQSRSELLHAKATGIMLEVDSAKQRLFDAGHAAEAAARPEAEKIIGQDLYPITATRVVKGLHLSASYDGATMGEDIVWEHKLANVNLLDSLSRGVIPEQYHPQLEQQLLVIGADKALFMATSSDKTAMEHVWYTSNTEMRQRLIAGWEQFAKDLAAYVPPEVIVPPVATPQMGLPAVAIQVTGSIALVDNLDKFGAALTAYVERINKNPETDQDFADLEATVKTLEAAEKALTAAENSAIAQTESIDTMRKTVALYRDTARTNRLLVEKLVKAEKENRRTAIISGAAAELVTHIYKLNERLGKPYMPSITADFQGVVKGLKSLDSMKDKVATELARCKIAANEAADRIQTNLCTLRELAKEHSFLFADTGTIVLKAPDDLTMLVKSRISEHQAAEQKRLDAERDRIRQEEQAKAEQAARDKLAAEQAAAAEEERKRLAAAPHAPVVTPTTAPASVPFEAVVSIMPSAVRKAMEPKTEPTLKLGDISTRLGFTVTADFLHVLGFDPAKTERASKLFHESDFPLMCQALIAHIGEVSEQFDAVAA